MALINYHTHTPMCAHASGAIEDYILAAMDKNFAELGFSDHAPLPDEIRNGITMAENELEVYIEEILKFKKKYNGRIDIKLGLEVDFPLQKTFDNKYFSDPRIDFLIGSCHFINGWPFDYEPFKDEFKNRDIDETYLSYYSLVDLLVDSRLYDIIGHFDIIKKFGYRAQRSFSREIEAISKKMSFHGLAAEINTSGLLRPVAEIYPSMDIIKIFYDNNVPVTLGSDCHAPELIDYKLREAVEMLKIAGYRKVSGFSGRKRYDIDIYEI